MADVLSGILVAQRLSKSFGGLRAVRDVTLTLNAKELHAVIGPNGAGKSTFVNLLSGQLTPTSGRLYLEGHDITGTRPFDMPRLGVSRSFQSTNIFKTLSVLENVRLGVQAVRLPARAILSTPQNQSSLIDAACAALARVGLSGHERTTAGVLSHPQGKTTIKLAVPPRERDWWCKLWDKILSPFPNCNAVENRPAFTC